MKTTLRLGYAAAFLSLVGATPALASDSVLVTSTLAKACQINETTSSVIDLTGYGVNQPKAGVFEYQCNYAGPNTIINIKSDNGGLKNGAHLAHYGVFLNDLSPATLGVPLPSQWHPSNNLLGGFPFFNISVPTTANVAKQPFFYVGLTQPTNVAGTYSDLLTISISP